jgi:5-hydroxyisourate hydrolase
MSGISTHVLDTSSGRPAPGIRVSLERQSGDAHWMPLGEGATGANGRIAQFLPGGTALQPGTYRLIFHIAAYFEQQDSFYPEITVEFRVTDPEAHYHVPLLLSAYGYTTYRGS